MAGFVGMNEILFIGAIMSMKNTADSMNTTLEQWSSMGEKAMAFEKYVSQYEQLQTILQSYQSLIRKDIEAINSIGSQIKIMDNLLVKLWK